MILPGDIIDFGDQNIFTYLGDHYWMTDGEVVHRPYWMKYVEAFLPGGIYKKL